MNSPSDDIKIENGLGFKLSADGHKLFAIVNPCEDRIDLTADVFKQRLEVAQFAELFINESLVIELLRRYKNSPDETYEMEIGERRDATCTISISENKLKAHLTLTPRFGGKVVTLTDVQKLLEDKKIVWGIVPTEEIEEVLAKGHAADFILAEGLEPEAGVNAQFQSLMPEAHERKPLVDENGDVDYRELGDIVIVHKGDLLMQRIPPIQGKKGRNVLGEIINPAGGADTPFSGHKKRV